MITYRQTTVPVIYTKLKFMRASWPSILADCPDDLPLLQQIQSVAAGHACVSKLERSYQLIVKAEFPDDILERNGSSNEVIEWRSYYWKLYDAQSLVTDRDPPAEAIHIDKAGINTQFLDSLAHPKSCLPMLRATQNVIGEVGYTLDPGTASELEHIEKPLIARLKLTCVTCRSCNRGKRDNLAIEDIEYYRSKFSNQRHPNHKILPHLTKIFELQKL